MNVAYTALSKTILEPGHNVWRIEPARRAAVLIDAAAFFQAVREAFLRARRSILMVGWDIHSQTRLVGENGVVADGWPEVFVDFLRELASERPQLRIHLLLWNYSVLYAAEREWFPSLTLDWPTPPHVLVRMDDNVPAVSSQHQKIIVVDDEVAFCGGLDVTIRRWDTPEHRLLDPNRVDPAGKPYAPFHDVHMVVDGAPARALGEIAKTRWRRATGEDLPGARGRGDPWPPSVRPDFTNVEVGIARTEPPYNGVPEVREVEALFFDSIDRASRMLYVENQFVTSAEFAHRLAARLRQEPKLEALFVVPQTFHSWIESRTMRIGRIRFRRILEEAGVADRVRLVYPQVSDGDRVGDTMVHSKVMIVDDRLLRVGSANLNNRSMGADTECDLVIEAENSEQGAAIARVRNRLLADHCGVTEAEVGDAMARKRSFLSVAEELSGRGHRLRPVDDGDEEDSELPAPIERVADPTKPLDTSEILSAFIAEPAKRRWPTFVMLGLVGLVVLVLVLAWNYTSLAQYADPNVVRSALADLNPTWTPLIVLVMFVIAGLIAFPITVMIAATAAAFGPWLGFGYAAAGALTSAVVGYGVGRLLGKDALRRLLGNRLNRLRQKITRSGIVAVATVRLVPIAPFTAINLVAGASGIRFRDFVIGSVVGLAPGIVAMSVLGDQVFRLWNEPTPGRIAVVLVLIVGWIALTLVIQRLVTRWRGDES